MKRYKRHVVAGGRGRPALSFQSAGARKSDGACRQRWAATAAGAPPGHAPASGAGPRRLPLRAARRRGGRRCGADRRTPRALVGGERLRGRAADLAWGRQRARLDRTEPRRGAPGRGSRSRRRARFRSPGRFPPCRPTTASSGPASGAWSSAPPSSRRARSPPGRSERTNWPSEAMPAPTGAGASLGAPHGALRRRALTRCRGTARRAADRRAGPSRSDRRRTGAGSRRRCADAWPTTLAPPHRERPRRSATGLAPDSGRANRTNSVT